MKEWWKIKENSEENDNAEQGFAHVDVVEIYSKLLKQ